MSDALLLIAERERAARARFTAAARDLRAALAPSPLVRRGIRAKPWAAVAVAGAGGMVFARWLGSRPIASPTRSSSPTTRSSRDWGRLLVQVTQVVSALAAVKAAHAGPTASAPSDVRR